MAEDTKETKKQPKEQKPQVKIGLRKSSGCGCGCGCEIKPPMTKK